MARVVAYCRVSRAEQAQHGVSMEAQQAKIEAFCRCYEHTIVAVVEDPGESGKHLERPGIQRALLMMRAKEVDGICVMKLDRLTREPGDWATLLAHYFCSNSKYGSELFSVENLVDTRSAIGRFNLRLQIDLACLERETTVERTITALTHKRNNRQRCGEVLYGFDLGDDGKTLM